MINNCVDQLIAVDLRGTATEITPRNNYGITDDAKGPVTIHKLYINYLPHDIIVVEPSGFRHVVPKNSKMNFKGFIVRTIYTIDFPMVSKCLDLDSGFRGLPSDDITIIARVAQSSIENNLFRKITVGIDRIVTTKDLDNVGGNMYLVDADVVISTLSFDKAPAHPRARGTVSEKFFDDTLACETVGFSFGIGIEMINRQPGADPMYTYAAAGVRKVPISRCNNRPEGFYLTTLERDLDGEGRQKLICDFFPLSEANSIGVYKSVDEALTSGNIKLLREEEMSKMKHEADMYRTQNSLDKSRLDQSHDVFMANHNKKMAELTESAKQASLLHAEEMRVATHKANVIEQQHKDTAADLIRQDKSKDLQHEINVRKIKEESLLSIQNHEEFMRMQQIAYDERERNHKLQVMNLDKEREGLKDYYDNKNYKRKDGQEVLKIISATITTMGVLFLAYNKTFGKS